MFKICLTLSLFFSFPIYGIEKLPDTYQVAFGNPEAKVKVVEYFSLVCPHCLTLFRKDFKVIKEKYIDPGHVYWVFHPVPQDLVTVQALACLKTLTAREQRVFLEALMEEVEIEEPLLSTQLMIKAMEIFGKPIPDLQEKEYLSNTDAFQEAFKFLKQEDSIRAIPSVEINSVYFSKEVPDVAFITHQFERLQEEHAIPQH